MAIFPL